MGMKLGHVLQSALMVDIGLDRYRSDELKHAARFWVGKEAGSYNKDKCVAALTRVMNSDGSAQRVCAALSEKEQQVLAIFVRYGPTVPGGLLTAEMYARGLAEKPLKDQDRRLYYRSYREQRQNDLVRGLCEKLVLIGNADDWYYSSFDRHYPRLTLHPSLVKAVAPADPLPWSASTVCDKVVETFSRSSAEVALDLWRVAAALRRMGIWPTVQGDSPSKATRARLRKEVGLRRAEQDFLSPPDPESLYYELLHSMRLMDFSAKPSWIRREALERHLQQPPAAQAWHVVRAWLHMALWQDGIGVVPDRDNDYNPVRIEPSRLHHARELLAWALAGVAHAPDEWLDLETFLRDLWKATREASIDFYWGSYTWNPDFEMARKREQYPAGENRTLAFWFADEAVWAANAIIVTLVTLGLVERGQTAGKNCRPCFRLTELGRAVFGAPEIEAAHRQGDARFLMVQPNLEVVAYLDSADARQICTLARFAADASQVGGPVQIFALRRESVYMALESGMTLEEVRTYLTEHGKNQLPANVERTLSEWAGRRESLVLRTNVVLALGPNESGTRGRTLSPGAFLLPSVSVKKTAQEFAGWTVLDHEGKSERTWTADELGSLTSIGGHSISRLRLARIADLAETGWRITQQSIERASMSGLTADHILGWLGEHLTADIPALLEMAVRNWTGQQGVRLGQAQLLRVAQKQAREAILHSATFRPLLAGHIPPEWFVIRDDHLSEVRRLLERLGFTIGDLLDPSPPGAVEAPATDPPAVIYRINRIPKRRRRA
jgi:hypothetical protein